MIQLTVYAQKVRYVFIKSCNLESPILNAQHEISKNELESTSFDQLDENSGKIS